MSDHVEIDIDGAEELTAAFERAPEEVLGALRHTLDTNAERIQRAWRSNARKTARRHGKRYPSSITTTLGEDSDGLRADIGPRVDRPQGRMGPGFEYGSVHQPPHHDGAQAFTAHQQRFVDDVTAAVEDATGKAIGR